MWRLALKQYQTESLSILRNYAAAVREIVTWRSSPEHDAFAEFTERDYLSTPGFGGVPYVCLRIPTGRGETSSGRSCCRCRRPKLACNRPASRSVDHSEHDDSRPNASWSEESRPVLTARRLRKSWEQRLKS